MSCGEVLIMPSRRQCKRNTNATHDALTEQHNKQQKLEPPLLFPNPYNAEVISLSDHSLGRLRENYRTWQTVEKIVNYATIETITRQRPVPTNPA